VKGQRFKEQGKGNFEFGSTEFTEGLILNFELRAKGQGHKYNGD